MMRGFCAEATGRALRALRCEMEKTPARAPLAGRRDSWTATRFRALWLEYVRLGGLTTVVTRAVPAQEVRRSAPIAGFADRCARIAPMTAAKCAAPPVRRIVADGVR